MPACDHGLWLGHTYVFQDPVLGSAGRLLSIELPSRHVKVLAHFSSDVASPDGRWIAGETESPPYRCGSAPPCHSGRWQIVALSPASHTCRLVIQGTGLTQDIAVDRSPWERQSGLVLSKDPVVWHNVAQGGTKIQVVTGPGTGFTRDSGSIIVATWQFRTHPIEKMGLTHKRLLKFNLSSLHTPAP